jgi:uncharacterized protein (TIGR03437 family)
MLYRFLLIPAGLASLAFGQTASLVSTFNFQNTLTSTQGGAALTAANPRNLNQFVTDTVAGQSRTVYELSSALPNLNAGLTLNAGGLLNPTTYSIEMMFTFTERQGTNRRLYDVLNRTSDRGLYVNQNNLFEFSRLTRGTATTNAGQYLHMVMTVAANRAIVYVNGMQDINLSTNSMNIELGNPVLHFFLDNLQDTGLNEFASARVALLKCYTNALTATEAQALAANPFNNNVGVGPPTFLTSGVRNGATFSETAPIAPGAFFSILGSSLAEATSDWTGRFDGANAPTTLNGARVLINDRPAFISFSSPGQINAIAPDTTPTSGNVNIVVERNGVRSTVVTAAARALNPAFFTYDQRNRRFIAALTADNSAYVAPADLFGTSTVNGLQVRPARPGEFVIAYGMGMGMTNPNVPAGTLPAPREGGYPVTGTVSLRFGSRTIQPLYTGLSSFAGVYLVGFQVPDLAAGDYELQITINGISSPTGVVIPVAM